jgi:hypothetical protein
MGTDTRAIAEAPATLEDEKPQVRVGEKAAYGIGRMTGTMFTATIGAFLLVFYTDVFGISSGAAGRRSLGASGAQARWQAAGGTRCRTR